MKAGDESAIADLRDALRRNLRKALSPHPRADESFLEDAVQDSILRIIQRVNQFQGRSRFLTWATSIAIHVAMGELRRKRWQDVSLDDVISDATGSPNFAIDRQATPDAELERKSLRALMERVIEEELTEKQRTALRAELKGMPQAEIARHLGSNRNAMYKLTHDARKKLKAGLEAAGYTATDVATMVTR
ncbi:RNA polymerase sigma factor [Rhodopirellula sp. JC639]|uniref:RNA polymerase sigma factor n=1 Tax=Stieleria mannarensis TaxID=2755585 RepID=UPI00160046BE|nr:sigma-70 family RNA polymerase sigma factor [Rhodopirellula sp. JC639]